MVDPQCRPATGDDLGELAWLEHLARSLVADRRGGTFWLERHGAQSPTWPAIGTGGVHVSTIDDVVVGYIRFGLADGVLQVEDVFVHPDAREVGCGERLLESAIDEGRKRGASRIVAEALPGDRETKNLYERAAITAILITVSAPIAPA